MNKIKTYKDLKDRKWEGEGIPKWIFKTGPCKVEELPDVYKHIYLEMIEKNPGYELFYFSDEDCALYIDDNYGEEYLKTYHNVIPTAYKADFWRYLILYKHGGCYGDFSQVMLVSFDSITEGMDRVFVVDTPDYSDCLYNAFMCNKPGDNVVRRAIDKTKENIDNKRYGSNVLDISGPRVLGRAYCEVMYNNTKSIIDAGVFGKTKILNNIDMHLNFIVDEDKTPLIVKKINNHHTVVYISRGVTHYSILWNERKAFK